MRIDAARTDLAHEIHAHGVTAEREERAVAERQNSAIAPDQIERERQDGVAEVFAEQRHDIGRHVKGRARRQEQIEQRNHRGQQGEHAQEDAAATIQALEKAGRDHASTARPLSANMPRGRR